jgi:hypothetical protein
MNFISQLLTLTNQLHIYHWQTPSGWHHAKLGDAYSSLDGMVDEFVEVFMGKNGKVTSKAGFDIKLVNITETSPESFIDTFISFLTSELPKILKKEDTDLLNIRDSMLAELNKLKYLLTLK